MSFEIEENGPNVHTIKQSFESDSRAALLMISDLHWDNPKCNRELLREHLDEAVDRGSPIVCFGDLFCAMQSTGDRRSAKPDLRPEHATGEYLDSLVNTAVDWFEPYKDNLALITLGNHETAVQKFHETNLIDRLAAGLRQRGGITRAGGYQGFVRYGMSYYTARKSATIFYHHGTGGGGYATKGMGDFIRMREQVEADVYVSGHIHRRNADDGLTMTLSQSGAIELRERHYVRTSTYKQEGHKPSGFATERLMGPRPLGGHWLEVERIGKAEYRRRVVPTWGSH